jgi:hypothetical protein
MLVWWFSHLEGDEIMLIASGSWRHCYSCIERNRMARKVKQLAGLGQAESAPSALFGA